MSYTVIQIVDNKASVLPTTSDLDNDDIDSYIKKLHYIDINNSQKHINSIITDKEDITMDGYYIQYTNSSGVFNIIQRQSKLVPGYIFNSMDQTQNIIGTIQIVKNNLNDKSSSKQSTDKVDDFVIIPESKKSKQSSKQLMTFSPDIINEFMDKLKKQKEKKPFKYVPKTNKYTTPPNIKQQIGEEFMKSLTKMKQKQKEDSDKFDQYLDKSDKENNLIL